MRELSLHILDIVTNSIEAAATRVIIWIEESIAVNLFSITIRDNGRGMSPETVARVIDPFVTSRSTRSVGMGLPLLRQAALACNGELKIVSKPGAGTSVKVTFQHNSLNRAPLGDMAGTFVNLVIAAPDVHFVYGHRTDCSYFTFDSFWFYGRMAEMDCSQYALVEPAQALIREKLQIVHSSG